MKRGTGPGACQPVDGTDDERQNGLDRRSGRDRRHSGEHEAPSDEPRAYGFRDFDPRRGNQDRRLYGIDGGRLSAGEHEDEPVDDSVEPETEAEAEAEAEAGDPLEGLLPLSPDQLRTLLRKDGR
ncbi:hypothetical protein DF3PA_110012 [Candidatus Defluviicoccus seviourii]|uniref:Uncharacterized protein n=2 Tax=root TaxID=1 RepID=A0A564W9X0_9PROT|nr:hypothetical protein DF3PB_3020008 [uncultured Defluviicoccus sp.]VUX45278.1 hypothetical protein DF3PA_110012 [Candidatus Defluviicoccus seviourii]